MSTDAGHLFHFRKRHRLADDDHFPRPKHRRLADDDHSPRPKHPRQADDDLLPRPKHRRLADGDLFLRRKHPRQADDDLFPRPKHPRLADDDHFLRRKHPRQADDDLFPRRKYPRLADDDHFPRRKHPRLADDLFHRRLHDAGHLFLRHKHPRPADDLFHRRRLHEPTSLFDPVPCCLLRRPPIPPEAGVSEFDMGNFLSNACPGCMPRDGGLEMYRDWADASKDARDLTVATRDGVGLGHGLLSQMILDVPDLTVATRDGVGLGHSVLSRTILDPRKAALQAVVPPWEKREPHYKDALKKAVSRDKRLGEIEAEVRLELEKLDELRKPKEDLSQFFIPLTAEDKEEVHDCLYGSGSSNQVLVLHESSNIEISKEKIRCLRPHGWLNDEVINLFLELLKERGIREPKRSLKCHFFNTFFYKKLACGKNGYDYKSVKRWTTHRKLGYELIECDKIFVPVHQHVHWCLAIINMKAKTLQYLDSLGGNDPRVPEMLARYIVEEVKDKSNKEIDINSWTKEVVDYVPLQQNGYDCGMFMLKYMDFLSRGASLSFGQEHMEYFRKRTVKEIIKLRAD